MARNASGLVRHLSLIGTRTLHLVSLSCDATQFGNPSDVIVHGTASP